MKSLILDKRISFGGPYIWRFDGSFGTKTTTSTYLKQSNNWLGLLKAIRIADPEMGIDACSAGSDYFNWDVLEYADGYQVTDYNQEGNFYAAALYPLTKQALQYGGGNGTTMTDETMEKTRTSLELSYYLKSIGLYGRYSKFVQPEVVGTAHEYEYWQLNNPDRSKAMIEHWIETPAPAGKITVYPKKLDPAALYTVSLYKDSAVHPGTETGAFWMANGITIENPVAGEKIFFNVPQYPGSGADTEGPAAPTGITKKLAGYLGHSGVELNWTELRTIFG